MTFSELKIEIVPIVYFVFILCFVAVGAMIPRSMRTGGMALPGVESRDVPLIGYRPLAPDDVPLSSQSGQVTDCTGLDSSEVGSDFIFD